MPSLSSLFGVVSRELSGYGESKMIRGVGTDIVDVRRFERARKRYGRKFVRRLFTGEEIAYCEERYNPALHYAARFAAKEAVIKAVGKRLPFKEIEVVREENGRPFLHVEEYRLGYRWHLSLSHDGDYSLAYVIMEAVSEAG